MQTRRWLAPYLLLSLTWGLSFMFIEIALPVFSPFGIAFIRNLLGAAVLWSYLFYKKISIPRDRSVFGWIFLIGLCSNIIPVVIVPFAQTEVTSSLTGIINAMSPIFAVIFTLLLFKLRLHDSTNKRFNKTTSHLSLFTLNFELLFFTAHCLPFTLHLSLIATLYFNCTQ